MKVKIKDQDKNVRQLQMALNLVGINVDYITTDLIAKTLVVYSDKEGAMNLEDATDIKVEHEEKWDKYFESKTEEDD